ncbi:MAG: HAD family hydrolase [Bacteroidota bacterium]
MIHLLLLDLDNTLFETRSIGKSSVQALFDALHPLLAQRFAPATAQRITDELWTTPYDLVAQKHGLDVSFQQALTQAIERSDFTFDIQAFEDVQLLHQIPMEKVLVTTGFAKLQWAKIQSLGIASMFSHIYIDDLLDPERSFKKGIFQQILAKHQLSPESVMVIGDSPESELKAGRELEMTTVQFNKLGQPPSLLAQYHLSHYRDLLPLIQQLEETSKKQGNNE